MAWRGVVSNYNTKIAALPLLCFPTPMAASNKQVALTSSSAYAPPLNLKVPVFLQKLYKIVSEPDTNDVICWSDAGDSFFVLDHERLAKEHLGIWFKHNKFASFVRQLNMYGFHKIPHLQQGALKSSADTERPQFYHPDFVRGQEDRLILIERKKQTASNSKEQQGVVDFPAVAPTPVSQPQTDPATGQALDIHAIVNGIAAIRRHQANISTELNELKRSNQLLWRESMEARNRHQKQQDVLNRIVKFLAGVFGQRSTTPGPKEQERGPSPHSVVRSSRLMIGDKKRESFPRVEVVEVQDEEAASSAPAESPRPFASIETPASTTSPSSPDGTEISAFSVPTPHVDIAMSLPNSEAPATPLIDASASPSVNNSVISTQPRYPGPDVPEGLPPFSPTHSPSIGDQFQAALNYLTPADLQQLFASLNGQSFPDSLDFSSLQQAPQSDQPPPSSPTQSLTPFNFGSLSPTSPLPQLPPQSITGISDSDGLISLDEPYMEHWRQMSDIDKDVAKCDTRLDSFMHDLHDLGLDPSFLANTPANEVDGGEIDTSVLDSTALLPSPGINIANSTTNEELFNSFLNTIPSPVQPKEDDNVNRSVNMESLGDGSDGPPTSAMDMGSSTSQLGESPAPLSVTTPSESVGPSMNTRAQKRKSDSGMEVMKLQLPNPKTKRRKDSQLHLSSSCCIV
ncbi:hypothetical protein BDP27DRAFT_1312491 [Rhodocollybia butyracea]|uniref:HSF-type DNA-binding domain-containing protein n=1 Tax=Rhodocollybia butyracea TaxID=206335 RepID=A0A9P5UEZ4_9AGAR|nr:hypothetical protein BDP27DRAFT_1312491 [Rhodocollybia butyracea]